MTRISIARRQVGSLVAAVALAGCGIGGGSVEGTAETDRQAATIATAISYPRQSSAAGFERAVLATTRAKSSGFAVLEAHDITAKTLMDPLARLVILLHSDESESGLQTNPAVTACYRMDFNYYGAIGTPKRIHCPKEAVPGH